MRSQVQHDEPGPDLSTGDSVTTGTDPAQLRPHGSRRGFAAPVRRWAGRGVWWIQILVVVGVLAVTEVVVRAGLINPLFTSRPSQVAKAVWAELTHGPLGNSTVTTLYEVALSMAIASVVGIIAGYLLWRFTLLGTAYDPLLVALFSSPIILLYPIFLVLFGRTTLAIIAQGAVYGVLPTVIYTRQAFSGVPDKLLKVAAVTGLSIPQRFRKVLLPAAAPTIFLGVRLALTYTLISAVAMEYLVKIGGLGKYISDADLSFQIVDVYAGVVMVVVVTVGLILLTYAVQRTVAR